jgi:8-oxo-dGTP diphosphatase
MQEWVCCPFCGKPLTRENDGEREVPYCAPCGRFHYRNPIPCVTAVLETAEGILLILRGKEPKEGWWAPPGGFLDLGESAEEGARREFREETGLEATSLSLIGLASQHSDRFGSVLYAGYEVLRFEGTLRAGSDAREARFFPRDHLPPIAFSCLEDILRLHLERRPEPPKA